MYSEVVNNLENKELVNKLNKGGYEKLVELLISGDPEAFTKNGRLNKSGACRILGWKPKQLEEALKECRKIIE